MANGWWGGRLPIDNIIFSRLIFVGVRWRVASQRFKNLVKRAVTVKLPQLVNKPETGDELKEWLSQGYEKLNIGGGRKNLVGFINIDFIAYPDIRRGVIANILDLSFVPNACASHLHSNHVIEHLTQDQLQHQLREYHRILREDGILTIRCPNALGAAYGFWFEPVIEREKEEFIALGFPPDEKLADPGDKWLHRDLFGLLHWFYGDMGNIANEHRNIITPTKIKVCLERSGFRIIKMSDPEAVNIVVVARKSLEVVSFRNANNLK
jgi:SAM-dependent methyltransferase